jgi:hypothetical protein
MKRDVTTRALALVTLFTLPLAACGGSRNYARSAYGTQGGYSMKNVKAKPLSLMVAKKVARPLYIVLDSARVKSEFELETAGCAVARPDCERFKLMDVQSFVTRDLKSTMETYFTSVEIVPSAAAIPAAPHVVADVKIDDIRLNGLVRGPLTYSLIEMTWGFALRPSEQTEYSYSFAGTAASNDSYPTFEAGVATLVENALPAMLKKWTEEGGFDRMRDGK